MWAYGRKRIGVSACRRVGVFAKRRGGILYPGETGPAKDAIGREKLKRKITRRYAETPTRRYVSKGPRKTLKDTKLKNYSRPTRARCQEVPIRRPADRHPAVKTTQSCERTTNENSGG